MAKPLLEVDNLEVQYGRTAALRGVSVRVAEGEVVGIIGPNGAGKTTLLNTIVGLRKATRGTVRLRGQSLASLAPETILRLGICLVPEGRRIFATLSVYENLLIGATIRRRDPALNSDLDVLLDRFPILKTYLRTPAGKLSGGEQQQLAIARALLSKPRLLLLDEPSLGLSPLMVNTVFEILGALHQEGITVLLVEQTARRTIAFADRSYVISNGKVAFEGTRDSMMSLEPELEQAYFGVKET